MSKIDSSELLTQFEQHLTSLENSEETSAGQSAAEIDLFSLFTELAEVKSEVKRESRQVKSALDEFKTVFAAMEQQQQQSQASLERCRKQLDTQKQTLLQPVLLDLLDLRDRLAAGVASQVKPKGLARLFAGKQAQAQQGQTMTLRRLDDKLGQYQVKAIEAIGYPLDPETMRVVDTVQDSTLGNAIVTREIRKGYTWEGQLLRSAEVIANKPDA